MSTTTNEIIEKLKSITLLEAAELVYIRRPSVENINEAQAKLREVHLKLPELINWLETFKNFFDYAFNGDDKI